MKECFPEQASPERWKAAQPYLVCIYRDEGADSDPVLHHRIVLPDTMMQECLVYEGGHYMLHTDLACVNTVALEHYGANAYVALLARVLSQI